MESVGMEKSSFLSELSRKRESNQVKILRPQKVGAETRLGDKLHADLFALGAQEKLTVVQHQKTLLGSALQKQAGF